MIVTEEELSQGRYLILPAGWEEYGTPLQARARLAPIMRGKEREACYRPFALQCGADTDKGVLVCIVAKWLAPGKWAFEARAGDPEGNPQTEEVKADFDVINCFTEKVAARVRH